MSFLLSNCANIAKACQLASEQNCDAEIEVWRTLAALFHACTVAGFAHWHLSDPDLEALLHQLELLNLSRNNNDDNSKLNGHTP